MRDFPRRFLRNRTGNTAVLFSLAAIPILLIGGGSVNFYILHSERAQAQAAVDGAALAAVQVLNAKEAGAADAQLAAKRVLGVNSGDLPDLAGAQVVADVAAKSVTVTYRSRTKRSISAVIWDGKLDYKVEAIAKLSYTTLPICILITEETEKHTLMATGTSKVRFNQCVVQVNTQHWDAVETRDTASIISTDGKNCFVGDIHRGTVLPAKATDCTFFPDPFQGMAAPPQACQFNNVVVSAVKTLDPGVYCGGLKIHANTTFKKGLYTIKGGPFEISGAGVTKVDASAGAAFALVGAAAVLDFDTSATLTFKAPQDGSAGSFDGFVFFADQPSLAGSPDPKSTVKRANIDLSGIAYLRRHEIKLSSGAYLHASPGAIVADYILPDDANIDLDGLSADSSSYKAMRKIVDRVGIPVLTE